MAMTRKWVIKSQSIFSDNERKDYWEKTHILDDYASVWSMTEDSLLREKLVSKIRAVPTHGKILIPGCGSRVVLQNQLVESIQDIQEICCTDFTGVINLAKQKNYNPKIRYESKNSRNLGFKNEWDIVLNVNAILSESDEENRDILDSCFRALKPGGVLIGMFPTIFSALDMAYIDENEDRLSFIDLKRSAFYEEKQKLWQIFYTPLRLRRILIEAGFLLKEMEVYFCDSDYFIDHSRKYYGLNDIDAVIYELLVKAEKPSFFVG